MAPFPTSAPLCRLPQAYSIVAAAVRSQPHLRKATKNDTLPAPFKERLMLAVTEVNQCPLCSYAHTQKALESGIPADEVEGLLAGLQGNVPADQLPAVLFAQHYAESKGRPSAKAWQTLQNTYGLPLAKGILGAVRVIMMGNTYGIPLGSLKNRTKGKPDPRCSLGYELAFAASVLPFLLAALVQTAFANLTRRPLLKTTP